MQIDDAAGILDVFNPIIESGRYTVFEDSFSLEAEREFIQQFDPNGVFHVALQQADQRIVGFQNVERFSQYSRAFDHVGVIGTYVDLARRRQGIAARLFAATFDAAKRKGYEKLFAYVRADNPAALATYVSQGFRIIGTAQRQAKIRGKYIDEILIERFL